MMILVFSIMEVWLLNLTIRDIRLDVYFLTLCSNKINLNNMHSYNLYFGFFNMDITVTLDWC